MGFPVFIPTSYTSRYSLLGAMAAEFADALARAGAEINPDRSFPIGHPTLHLFFNFPANPEQFLEWVQPSRPGAVFIHFFVDHPLNLDSSIVDRFVSFPNYRLMLPCVDDRSLLQLRWPGLNSVTCQHAVDPSAICTATSIPGREPCITAAGTIASPAELETLRNALPEPMREACMLSAQLLAARPHVSPLQALDLFAPVGIRAGNQWQLLQRCALYVVAAANRTRRLALVTSLAGLPVRVYGNEAWRDECTGTVEYRGELDYSRLPGVLSASSIALAWNPTQFTHSLSERVLLCMGAGCATITDDRPMVRRCFGPVMLEQYEADQPESLRVRVEALLKDPDRCIEMGQSAREEILQKHLWDSRTDLVGRVVQSVLAAARQRSEPNSA